jgi:hypothetical protein
MGTFCVPTRIVYASLMFYPDSADALSGLLGCSARFIVSKWLITKMTLKLPEYLYHYTSINNLSLILDSKRLRFNRLDMVDDLTESISSDLGNFGRFYFVSCWTESSEECIPLWSMYTPNMAGVRIKLPAAMFKKYPVEPQNMPGLTVPEKFDSLLPLNEMLAENYLAGC